MTFRQLEILRALIRHRTTVAAAQDLALSQPAISNALKTMEGQAGFALFSRVNNRLFPTTEALALYKASETIFALHAKLESRVRDLRENRSGHLAIVGTPPLAYSVVPPALKRFLAARPGTQVFFDVRRYESVIEAVLSRVAELGFALGFSHQLGIAHEVVHTGEMVCVFAPGHVLARKDEVAAANLVGLPLIGLERGTRLGRRSAAASSRRARRSPPRWRCATATRPACWPRQGWALPWLTLSPPARVAATSWQCVPSRRQPRPSPICCGPRRNHCELCWRMGDAVIRRRSVLACW